MLDVAEIQRFGRGPDPQDANQKTEISEPIRDECFFAGICSSRPLEPKPDQQIAANADQFPKNEKLQKIVGENDSEHREGEQAEAGEEARKPWIIAHIAPGIDVN